MSDPEAADAVRILVVCSGNVCRSPLAAAMLADAASAIPGVTVSSAGTVAPVGSLMSPESAELARGYGLDPTPHRARQLSLDDLRSASLVLTASRQHRQQVARMLPKAARNLYTIREFGRLADAAAAGIDGAAGPHTVTGADTVTGPGPVRRSAADVQAAIAWVAARRGWYDGPDDPADDDIIDPIGLGWDMYQRMDAEMTPAVRSAARWLFGS